MGVVLESIISGVIWDLIKSGVRLTGIAIKEKLQDWILPVEDLQKIADRVNAAAETDKKSAKYIEAYLEEHQDLIDIIKSARQVNNSGVIVNGDNTGVVYSGDGGIVAPNSHITITPPVASDPSKKS